MMAGIFRHSSSSTSTPNESSTPNKRFSFGAFCTSPGTLQDVTMNNSYAVAGYRSLSGSLQPNYNGTASPSTQGRSVREFEEQLSALRKENFNLKLKLYFMEETLPGYQQALGNEGHEALAKQIIDSKVEIEMLRKECKEKQDLLREAAQAINHLEDIQKQTDEKYQTVVEELKQKINFMEMEREVERSQSSIDVANDTNEVADLVENINALQKISELESIIREHEERIEDFYEQISKLDEILIERDATIKECDAKIKTLEFQNSELIESLENKDKDFNIVENQQLRKEIQDLKIQMADKVCMLDETEEKLKHRTQVYEKALRTIQKLMLNIGSQKKEIAQLKLNQNETHCSHVTTSNKENVNITASGISGLDCSGISRSLSDSEVLSQNEQLIVDLRKQLQQAQTDADNADKWRSECADVCKVLTDRLEELAGFLNSLLKQKDVLGILAADRRRAIRKAVDRSLDLSKSLNMTLSFSGMSMADQSLARISNLSDLLGYDDLERTFNSHEDLTRASIESHKSEKQLAWKKETSNSDKYRRSGETKKERRSLPLHLPQENQSESEAWSEPDRKVSMARIGLDENSASLSKDIPVKTIAASSESECDIHNISRNAKQRTQERIVQLEQMITQRDERIIEIQSQLVDTDSCLKQENLRVLELQKEIQRLEEQISTHNSMINSSLLAQINEKSEALEQCHTELEELKLKHEIAIALAKEQLREKLKDLKVEMENKQQQSLEQLQEQHKTLIAQEYVALAQYDEIKVQLLELQRQYIEAQRIIDNLTDNEQEMKQILLDSEMEARSLKKQLDESTLQASKAIMERTKAFNDKLQLEKLVEQLKTQLTTLEADRSILQQNIIKLEEQLAPTKMIKNKNINNNGGSDASASGYTSEEVPHAFSDNSANSFNNMMSTKGLMITTEQRVITQRQINTSSPDLGIESDAGRVSSGELSSAQQQQKCNNKAKSVELNISLQQPKQDNNNAEKELCSDDSVENIKPELIKNENSSHSAINVPTTKTTSSIQHDCVKVEQENAELRRKLLHTKKAFEDTYEKLRIANQRKAQVEKDIKNQILKTHNVLRNVRSNMENEL